MWMVLQGRQNRRYGSSSMLLNRPDTSPLTIGAFTIERIVDATTSSASTLPMPAAFNGFVASKIRLPASSSENGSTAFATPGRSVRR